MEGISNYLLAWLVYIAAAAVFYVIFWHLTRFRGLRILKYCLRAVMLAMIATPWYVGSEGNLMAPAIIVMMMDAITISGAAGVRAFVPLLLSNILALALVVVVLVFRRGGKGRGGSPAE